jgi:hypothetical protein
MDKKDRELMQTLLGLDAVELQALNRALRYYVSRYRGHKDGKAYGVLQNMVLLENVQRWMVHLNPAEQNIMQVVLEGYDKGALEAPPHMWTTIINIHNRAHERLLRFDEREIGHLLAALAMYRATPGIAGKYKKECVGLRDKLFGERTHDTE